MLIDHTHPNQLKSASYEFFHRLAKIWANFRLLSLHTYVMGDPVLEHDKFVIFPVYILMSIVSPQV